MKLLIVLSNKTPNANFDLQRDVSFVYEQISALKKLGVEFDIFLIEEHGLFGYFKSIKPYRDMVKKTKYDWIHAHYGLAGFLAVFQMKVPVIITYHGSDINLLKHNIFSTLASLFARWRIFVSPKLYQKILIKPKKNHNIIPCGINLDTFVPIEKDEAKTKMRLDPQKKYVLFPSYFNNPIKNYPLAKKVIDEYKNLHLLELKGYKREEVCLLINSCEFILLTSFSEGSPMIVKEGMACNCPIVATDVGDIRKIFDNTPGYYISTFDPQNIKDNIQNVLSFQGKTNGREKIKAFDNSLIAKQIFSIYNSR